MTTAPDHIHVTERESDGSWENCTEASGLEWFRLVHDARKPATITEVNALRRASGRADTGGSNLNDFAKACKTRYGVTIADRQSGYAALRKALLPGYVAVVQGSMKAFGPAHRLSKWQTNFDASHAVLVMNLDDMLLWCDPLAPTNADVPVEVSWGDLKAYVDAFNGAFIVGRIKTLTQPEATVANLTSYLPGYTAEVKPKSNIRSEPFIKATLLHTVGDSPMKMAVVGTVEGDPDRGNNNSTVWYEFFNNGKSVYTAEENVVNLTAPVSSPQVPAYPDLRDELAAAVRSAETAHASGRNAGVDAEKARIKAVLGL